MATWTSLHSLVSLVVVVAASGYDVVDPFASVVVITPHCGDSTTDSAWLEVKTGVAISGEVVCESNERIAFRANDTATFYTPLFYDGSTTGRCVFAKKETADVYTIQVDVSRGERGSEIEAPEQKYQVRTEIRCRPYFPHPSLLPNPNLPSTTNSTINHILTLHTK